jgi:hypothetical protein
VAKGFKRGILLYGGKLSEGRERHIGVDAKYSIRTPKRKPLAF